MVYLNLLTNVRLWSISFLIVIASVAVVYLIFKIFGSLMDIIIRRRYDKKDLARIMLSMHAELEKSQYSQRAFEKKMEQKLELLGNAQVKTFKETGKALEIVANRLEAAKPTEDATKIKASINADFISLNRKLDAFLANRKQDEDSTLYILQKLKKIVGDTTLEDIDKMHRTAAKQEYHRIIGAIEEYMSGPYPKLKEDI